MEKTVYYLGIDVHSAASIWCLLDQKGERIATGSSDTTFPALSELATDLRGRGEFIAGQEVGTQSYLVADAFHHAGVPIQSFNAAHLRMIAASRKKTDRRDAFWIARSLQTGMTPHPVYLPTGQLRELRRLLHRRRIVQRDRNRWQYRARATLRSVGLRTRCGGHYLGKFMNQLIERPDGVDTHILESLGLAQRFITLLNEELSHIEAMLHVRTIDIDVMNRLQTIPGVGPICAATLYATIGDIHRFPNARALGSYAGLVPSVRQSGDVSRHGNITRAGSTHLRTVLVQSAHVATRITSSRADPIRAIYARIRGSRGRRKIALVAIARHLLRIAYYVWRDGTTFDPAKLRCPAD
ncbi:MAG: IS110 family transposase [Actinomycetales bacterium]|nr:IS110 family transposase [Actinomycetales bacterium]